MKLNKLSHPRDLLPREEALHIFRQDCSRTIPEPWLNLLLDEPRDKPRALSIEEARRVGFAALFVKTRGRPLSKEELLDELVRQFPALQTRTKNARAQLLASNYEDEKIDPKVKLIDAPAGRWEEGESKIDEAKCEALDIFCKSLSECEFEALFRQGYNEGFLQFTEDQLERFWGGIENAMAKRSDADSAKEDAGSPSFSVVPVSVRQSPELRVGGQPYLNVMERFFLRLRADGLEPAAAIPPARRWLAMHAGILMRTHRPHVLTNEDMRHLRALASFTLAQLRGDVKLVAKGDEAEANRRFTQRLHAYTLATECLLIVDDLAFMLSQLLQLLRVSPIPLVGEDLAYWRGVRSGLLDRVSVNLVNSIHYMATGLEESDPKLRRVREDLALFCLARLGQKKGEKCGEGLASESSMVEPDPFWRACYMHAIDALRVNPDGKGHRALYWSMQHDPDEGVREVAKELYPGVERKREIADGSSPRRPLITAIWWMLQAHRLCLGLEVDDNAIQATLAAMMRRTTESLSPAPTVGSYEKPKTTHNE